MGGIVLLVATAIARAISAEGKLFVADLELHLTTVCTEPLPFAGLGRYLLAQSRGLVVHIAVCGFSAKVVHKTLIEVAVYQIQTDCGDRSLWP